MLRGHSSARFAMSNCRLSHTSNPRVAAGKIEPAKVQSLYIAVLAQLAAILPPFDAQRSKDPRREEVEQGEMINYEGVTRKGTEWDQTKSDDGTSSRCVPRGHG